MTRKNIGLIILIVGIVLLALSLLADLIGIGSYPGLNWAQITGAGVGLAVAIGGLYLLSRKDKKT